MGITTNGLSVIAANMTGSALPTAIGIGTSGTAFTIGDTALANEVERNLYSTNDLSTSTQVTFTSDWSPVEVSGLIIKEHGMFTAGSIVPQLWMLNAVNEELSNKPMLKSVDEALIKLN